MKRPPSCEPRLAPAKLKRILTRPAPFIHNPGEPQHFALGRFSLYIGARAEPRKATSISISFHALSHGSADAKALPFPDSLFTMVECDAVLEHVQSPERVTRELQRVLQPGGYVHVITPFCPSPSSK